MERKALKIDGGMGRVEEKGSGLAARTGRGKRRQRDTEVDWGFCGGSERT